MAPHRAERITRTGNRLWIVSTPAGPAIQKLYAPGRGLLRTALRCFLVGVARLKTGYGATARWRTEKRLLALWRTQGFDVPRDLSDRYPHLAPERVLLMELVAAPTLGNLLRQRLFDRSARSTLLRRFARVWGRRHRHAMDTAEAGLVQEHGTFDHVFAADDRFVHFDLEHAYRPRRNVAPIVAKEIAGYLRTLWRRTDPVTFSRDLDALVEGYPHPEILHAAAETYLRGGLVWRLDRLFRRIRRKRGGKYAPLRALAKLLRAREDDADQEGTGRP